MNKLRKVDDLKGRHKLAVPGLGGCSGAIHLAFPRYQHIPRAGQPSLIPTNGDRVMVVVQDYPSKPFQCWRPGAPTKMVLVFRLQEELRVFCQEYAAKPVRSTREDAYRGITLLCLNGRAGWRDLPWERC